jgi:hypothetical protein
MKCTSCDKLIAVLLQSTEVLFLEQNLDKIYFITLYFSLFHLHFTSFRFALFCVIFLIYFISHYFVFFRFISFYFLFYFCFII